MPPPVIVPTAVGVAEKASKWVVQVDTASSQSSPTWVTVFGVESNVPGKTDNMVDTTDFDSVGWSSTQPFLSSWTLTAGLQRKRYAGALDAGQEFLRAQNDAKLSVHVRWFDRTGGVEAYEGWGFNTWENQGGDANTAEKVNVTINSNGARTAIANPVATSVVPSISGATPPNQTAGKIVTITGANFTGATGITFNAVAVAAGAYNIVNDNIISAVMPAGSAGPGNIIVTNAVGPSTPAFPYTRGA